MAAEVTSRDGTVTVRAAEGGLVHEVRLSESAMSSDAETLSATITSAVREAVAGAAGDFLVATPTVGTQQEAEESVGHGEEPGGDEDDGPVFTGLASG